MTTNSEQADALERKQANFRIYVKACEAGTKDGRFPRNTTLGGVQWSQASFISMRLEKHALNFSTAPKQYAQDICQAWEKEFGYNLNLQTAA